jgi:hypothetical protein
MKWKSNKQIKKNKDMKNYATVNAEPTAYISVKKQRVKQNGKHVYLQDNSEFEIELYNPTQVKVLVKILMNGNFISNSGIVLRPGERVYLERYLDSSRKFKFETYSVSNTKNNLNAIENNGLVEVYFYKEQSTSTSPNIFLTDTITYHPQKYWYSTTTGSLSSSSSNNTYFTTNSFANISSEVKNIETGRIEQGSNSSQKFVNTSDTFELYNSWVSSWKILPISQKPLTSKDLTPKCIKCNTKIKSGWKFCPQCGTETSTLDITEEFLGSLSKDELIKMLIEK